MNYPASRSDIYFAKNVTNDIDFFVKDIDRKPLPRGVEPLVLRVADRNSGKVVLTLRLDLVEADKARYRATIPPEAIEGLALGMYSYTVTRTVAGAERLLYADRSRTERGYVEVREGPIPAEAAPHTILVDDLLPIDADLVSGAFPGAAAVGSVDGVMSVAVYGNHFTGTVIMQASLDAEVPTDDAGWFTLAEAAYEDLTGVSGFSVEGNVTWVRFRVSDRTLPAPQDGGTGGSTSVSCLACDLGAASGATDNPIDWPADTPRGLVKIVYRA